MEKPSWRGLFIERKDKCALPIRRGLNPASRRECAPDKGAHSAIKMTISHFAADYIIPGIPPIPPIPPGIPPPIAGASSFGRSAIIVSVVSIRPATDAAF